LPKEFKGGRVKVYGRSRGCLAVSIGLSGLLTVDTNACMSRTVPATGSASSAPDRTPGRNHMLNPIRQRHSLDPEGVYAGRYLPELGAAEYPNPGIAQEDAVARFRGEGAP
jgi:hypothetical protein